MIGCIIGFMFFFTVVGSFEYIKYRKRKLREKNAIYVNIEGKIINKYIINQPYFAQVPLSGRTRTTVKSLYMLIFEVEDSRGRVLKVKVVQAEFYDQIDYDGYLDIGERISWKIKKYPETDIYVFVDNL